MKSKLVLSDSKHIWLLDAGHGSDTPGKRSPVWPDSSQLLEWQYTRKVRKELAKLLDVYNISYAIVNPEEYDISLTERSNRINEISRKYPSCKGISIHGNAAGVESATGYEVYTSPGDTAADPIADIFFRHAEITKIFRMRRDRTDGDNDKEARFAILMNTVCPMILTESGFYSNEIECKKMLTHPFILQVAIMHFTAILEIENR